MPMARQAELGRTDAEGRLSLDLSSVGNGTVDLQVDGGPGHRDYLELPVQDGEVDRTRWSCSPSAW